MADLRESFKYVCAQIAQQQDFYVAQNMPLVLLPQIDRDPIQIIYCKNNHLVVETYSADGEPHENSPQSFIFGALELKTREDHIILNDIFTEMIIGQFMNPTLRMAAFALIQTALNDKESNHLSQTRRISQEEAPLFLG